MNKLIKIEISLALVLTLIAIIVWGVFLNERNTANNPPENDEQMEEKVDTNLNFGFEFEEENLTIENNQEFTLNVNTNGIEEKIEAAEAILTFNPLIFRAIEIENGNVFETYIGEEIDNEVGIVRLSGAFSDEGTNSDGIFMSIIFQRVSEGLGTISIVGSESSSEAKSKVTTESTGEADVRGDVLNIN